MGIWNAGYEGLGKWKIIDDWFWGMCYVYGGINKSVPDYDKKNYILIRIFNPDIRFVFTGRYMGCVFGTI